MSEFTQKAPEVKKLGELQQEKDTEVRHAVELDASKREAYCKGFYDGFKMARDVLKVAHEAQYEAARHDVELKIEVGAEVRPCHKTEKNGLQKCGSITSIATHG